jgi:hypothetical protein
MKGTGNPESLHQIGESREKMTKNEFVNPGTPSSGFVSKEQRKHAKVQGANQAALTKKMMYPNEI